MLWGTAVALFCLLFFSVYPNYILKGHHNKLFLYARETCDIIMRKIVPQKTTNLLAMTLDSKSIELVKGSGLPARISHPLTITLMPDQVPAKAYFNKPTTPILFGTTMIPEPFTTYAPLPGNISGLSVHNRQQFRYPFDLAKKKKNEFRIFITGGSVAWGSAATSGESTIAGFMEKELRIKYPGVDIKVITAAASGWSSTQERIWIFNRITEYEPDVIISYSGHNDLESYLQHHDLYDRYYLDGQYFRNAIQYYDYYNRGEAVAMLGSDNTGFRFDVSDFPRKSLKNIKIISSYLKSDKIKFVYVLQPVAKFKGKFDFFYERYNILNKESAAQAKSEGYQYIDHSGLFDGNPELFIDFCHPGDRGYQIIAKDLISKIILDPDKMKVIAHQ